MIPGSPRSIPDALRKGKSRSARDGLEDAESEAMNYEEREKTTLRRQIVSSKVLIVTDPEAPIGLARLANAIFLK